jgi:hypothetical protein
MPRVRLREQRTLRPRGVARTFSMQALPPFRLDLTASALRRRPDNAVDVWDGRTYRRVLTFEGEAIELAAVQAGSSAAPRLMVTLTGAQLDQQTEEAARAVLARLLGLELDLFPFYRHAEGDPLLRTLAVRFRGLKPPRFPTLFECLVNAIACQQLTLTVGIRLLNRLAEAYGTASGEGTPTTAARSPRSCGCAASAAGRPNTPCCAGSAGSTSSPATTSAPATTSRGGSAVAGRSTTPAFSPPCTGGSRSPGSSTSTSYSPTSPSTASCLRAPASDVRARGEATRIG